MTWYIVTLVMFNDEELLVWMFLLPIDVQCCLLDLDVCCFEQLDVKII